jgi:hypothetical protein
MAFPKIRQKKGVVDLSEKKLTVRVAIVSMNRSIFCQLHNPKIGSSRIRKTPSLQRRYDFNMPVGVDC